MTPETPSATPSTTPPNEPKKDKNWKSPSSSSVSMREENDQRLDCSTEAKNSAAAVVASGREQGAIYDPIATTLFLDRQGGDLCKNANSKNMVGEPHSTMNSGQANSHNASEKTTQDKGSMVSDEVQRGRSAPMANKMSKRRGTKKKTRNKTGKKKIRINIVSGTGKKEQVAGESEDSRCATRTEKGWNRSRPLDDAVQQHETAFGSEAKNSFFCCNDEGPQINERESHLHLLDFYSETHEDQDPTFREHAKLKKKERQDAELANLQKEEKEQRVRLEAHLKKMWQNQIETMQESIKERRDAMMAKQETQRQQLLSTQKKRMESFQAKVQQSMTYQLQKQTGEKTSALQQHKQRTSDQIRAAKSQNERHSIQQEAMSVWTRISQQIQAKHQQEIQQFRLKEQEDQKKLEKRFKDQTQMLSQHHIMRQKEMMYDIQQEQKLFKSQRQHQQLYHVRLHRERTKKRTQQVLDKVRSCKYYPSSSLQESLDSSLLSEDDAEIATNQEKRNSSRADPKLSKSDSTVSDQSTPVKDSVRPVSGASKSSGTEKDSFFQPEHSDAVLRQKLRKTVMSGTPIQLAVDLHNEGIVVHFRSGNQQASSGTPSSADSASNSKDKKVDLRGSPSSEPEGTGQGPSDTGDGGSSSGGGNGGGATSAPNSGRTWSSGSGGGTSEFIPWGVRAREVLYAIMCGEVPSGYASDKIDASGQGLLQGGQIKCMVTDMRTSDSVAAAQRALAMMDLEKEKAKAEITVLEKKAAEFRAKLADKEKLSYRALREEKERNQDLNKANSDVEKTKRLFQELQMKSAGYCGPGGAALNPNIPEQRQLLEAMLRCKADIEVAEKREAAARQAFDRARSVAAKTQIAFSQSQKISNAADAAVKKAIKKMQNDEAGASSGVNSKKSRSDEEPDSEQSSKRIADVLSAIRATTDRRRKQLDSKRNCDTYLATSDQQMSTALKTSFRQKMEHRRLTIVLRPTRASIIKEVEHVVRAAEAKRAGSTVRQDDDSVGNEDELDPVLRAEQRLLLLLHPESPPEVLPSVPSVEKWAEPGWQVVLQAPSARNACRGQGYSSGSLLPKVERYPLLEIAQSTCCSAPGRQSAKIIKPWHLRMLSAPLSTVSRASAPAEPLPKDVAEILSAPVGLDPYNITHEEMEAGYNFVAPEPTKAPKQVRKRSVNAPKETKEVVTPVAKKQRSTGTKAVEQDPNASPNKGASSAQKAEKYNTRERNDKSKVAQSDSTTAKHILRSPIPADKNKDVTQKQKEVSKEIKKHHQPHGQAMSKDKMGGNTDQQYMAGIFPQQHSSPEQQQALFHRMMNQQKPMMQQPNMQNMQMHLSQQQGPPRQHAQQFQHQNRQNQQYQQQQQQYHQQRQLAQMRMQQQQMAYAAQSQPPQAPQANAHYPQQMVPSQRPPAFSGQQGMPTAGSTGAMGSNTQQPPQRPPNATARRTNPGSGEEIDPLDDPLLMLFDEGNF